MINCPTISIPNKGYRLKVSGYRGNNSKERRSKGGEGDLLFQVLNRTRERIKLLHYPLLFRKRENGDKNVALLDNIIIEYCTRIESTCFAGFTSLIRIRGMLFESSEKSDIYSSCFGCKYKQNI